MNSRRIITGAVVLFVLAAPSFGAAAPVSYADPTGDNAGGADIGAVTIDLGADGKISIEVSIASIPQLGDEALVFAALDTDRNPTTGSIFGGDYVVVFAFEDLSLDLVRWDGTQYVDATGDVTALLGSGSVEVQLHPDAIGGTTAFDFTVAATTGPPETGSGTGRGGCSFKLPKNARGKRLLVTLFVTYSGVTEKFEPYVFKVR